MKQLLAAFARNRVFANIVLIMLLFSGGLASVFMIKETFPEFSLDMISISVPYPGADPEEVEEGISRKIEEALERVEGIKQYTTKSAENIGTAMLEVKENYNVRDVLDRVRTKVDAISTFPLDAEKPVISELILKDTVTLVYLSGGMSERRLKEWAERIKDEITQLPPVSQVTIFGVRDYEINIEVSEERLREYQLTIDAVADAVRRSNLNLAGGTIRTLGEEIRIRTIGRKYTGKELANIVVLARPEGEIVTLDRLAVIKDDFTEDAIAATINGEPAVLLIVYKTQEEDALAISKAMHTFVDSYRPRLPEGANMAILYESTDMLRARIDLLVENGIIGLIIVFILLWLFLNTRLSLWAGMGIPISIAGALMILWAMGETINMISLFGLIMVLGIVVDDAIVVGEAIYVHRQNGAPPLDAAINGVLEVGMPVIAAVLTTIVAFIPLAYIGGIMGKFISILPVVVIACLVVSLAECLFLLPAHLNHLSIIHAPPTDQHPFVLTCARLRLFPGIALAWFISRIYRPVLKRALYWRYISFCVAIATLLITIGFVKGGLLKFQVFPEIDGFVITANIEFSNGTPPEITRQAVHQVEAALTRLARKTKTVSGKPLVKHHLTLVGQTLADIPETGPHLGGVQAILLDTAERGIHSEDIMVQWEKEVGAIAGIKSLTLQGLSAGPPGAPIEVWIQGRDMTHILSAADDLMDKLRQYDGVYQIRSDFSPGKNEIRLTLKPEAHALGLTVSDLARQIQAGYYGNEALRIQRGRNDVRIKIRYTAKERSRISDLEKARIRTATGVEVPLLTVAHVAFSPGYSTITRTDGLRRVAVSAAVDSNRANTSEIFAELSSTFFGQLKERYPDIYVALQGEKKKMRESFGSLKIGYPLAILGIFIIISTMFRSYAQPFLILFTIPFGIIGGIGAHLIMGFDLSLMSVFGMVALTGVVVNDAIVLIERVNENLSQQMTFFEAIQQGGVRRFRAIFLTSVSTIGGLTPLILETDLQARFLIPMALSIAGGVAFATVLTLLLIPSLLVILNDFRCVFHRITTGQWLTQREQAEPAYSRTKDL
jgi:multidrug efflux pump subunit AcrB